MKFKNIAIATALIASLTSCELLDQVNTGLTSDEIVQGLKTALTVGTDSSSTKLSSLDGYYKNEILKIGLPAEANTILLHKDEAIFVSLGLNTLIDAQIEDVIKGINRSAENAAKDAAPIFKNAITNLSILDGLSILNGKVPTTTKSGTETFDSLAATNYLKAQTYSDLTATFSPYISSSLSKDLGLGFSANTAWTTLTNYYNQGVNKYNATIGLFGSKMETVSADLATHCTSKALNGLFIKVGEQEKGIRNNPFGYASDILQKVFSSVHN